MRRTQGRETIAIISVVVLETLHKSDMEDCGSASRGRVEALERVTGEERLSHVVGHVEEGEEVGLYRADARA